ncbi:hypothetical protein [Sporosarcina sp. P37]|uniref:hypothetical protein n=1 Tax=Sporosarcina sp. P37 TaxID=1930546 RepID=UPI001E615A16|nr:hypothetical protein [Sporosarcina sp. P37]
MHTPVTKQSLNFFSFKLQPRLLPLSSAGTTAGSAEVMRQLAPHYRQLAHDVRQSPTCLRGSKGLTLATSIPDTQSSYDPKTETERY